MKTVPRMPGAREVPSAATLKHVAERAGVSPITVSRALNKPAMVSADLRDRVRRAVDELGYVQNRVAGALASKWPPTNSLAMSAKVWWRSSARPFIAIMVAAGMRPASACSACHCAGWRAGAGEAKPRP